MCVFMKDSGYLCGVWRRPSGSLQTRSLRILFQAPLDVDLHPGSEKQQLQNRTNGSERSTGAEAASAALIQKVADLQNQGEGGEVNMKEEPPSFAPS